jgi:hypothetical protein
MLGAYYAVLAKKEEDIDDLLHELDMRVHSLDM